MSTVYPVVINPDTYANAAALTAVDASLYRNGARAKVTSVGMFYLDLTSTATPDGTTVIDATPTGNWLLDPAAYIMLDDNNVFDSSQLPFSYIKTDNQQFVSIQQVILASAGTWTKTRVSQGLFVYRHTAANDTSILGIDITPMIRSTASMGFSLASYDVIYQIGTAALDAHTVTLNAVSYANNSAPVSTAITTTGSLATATQAQPYVSNIVVTTPTYATTADSKYVVELTVDAATTSAYDFIGLNLKFSQNSIANS